MMMIYDFPNAAPLIKIANHQEMFSPDPGYR